MKPKLHFAIVLFFLFATTQKICAFDPKAPVLTVTHIIKNVSVCGNGHDGSIIVTATGGIAPYSYNWTGSYGYTAQNTSTISNLSFGYYNVTVTDAVQNTFTLSGIHIGAAFAVYITNSGAMASSCANNGAIVLYGNSGVLPYTYSLDGTAYQSANIFTNLAAGLYTAYIKDAAGCVSTKSIQLPSAPPITVSPFVRPAKSCANDGSIEIYRTGGIPPYTYSLDNINYQPGNKYFNLAGGNYTAWVKDSKGCTGSQQLVLPQAAPMVIDPSSTNSSSCADDGTIKALLTGGDPYYIYSINGGDYQESNSFTNLAADTYEINVIDSKGCTASTIVEILQNPIHVTATKTDASDCTSIDGSIEISASGDFGPFTYSVDNFNYQESNLFNTISSGIYYCYAKDSKGCIGMFPGIAIGPFGCSPERMSHTGKMNKTAIKTVLEVIAYPNPSATEFLILLHGFNSREKVAITVTDLSGKKVYQTIETLKQQYKLGKNLSPGMYNIQVVQGTEKKNIKVIKE